MSSVSLVVHSDDYRLEDGEAASLYICHAPLEPAALRAAFDGLYCLVGGEIWFGNSRVHTDGKWFEVWVTPDEESMRKIESIRNTLGPEYTHWRDPHVVVERFSDKEAARELCKDISVVHAKCIGLLAK